MLLRMPDARAKIRELRRLVADLGIVAKLARAATPTRRAGAHPPL